MFPNLEFIYLITNKLSKYTVIALHESKTLFSEARTVCHNVHFGKLYAHHESWSWYYLSNFCVWSDIMNGKHKRVRVKNNRCCVNLCTINWDFLSSLLCNFNKLRLTQAKTRHLVNRSGDQSLMKWVQRFFPSVSCDNGIQIMILTILNHVVH